MTALQKAMVEAAADDGWADIKQIVLVEEMGSYFVGIPPRVPGAERPVTYDKIPEIPMSKLKHFRVDFLLRYPGASGPEPHMQIVSAFSEDHAREVVMGLCDGGNDEWEVICEILRVVGIIDVSAN